MINTCFTGCQPGYYWNRFSEGCDACPKGKYRGIMDPNNDCRWCPAGKTTAEEAQISENACGKLKKSEW